MEAGTPMTRHGAGHCRSGVGGSTAALPSWMIFWKKGILVLLSAVDKFDPSKDVKFETYVSKRLRGHDREPGGHQDWLRVKCGRKSIRLNRAREELSMQMGRTPSSAEMADHLGVTRGGIWGYALWRQRCPACFPFEALLDTQGRGARQRSRGKQEPARRAVRGAGAA